MPSSRYSLRLKLTRNGRNYFLLTLTCVTYVTVSNIKGVVHSKLKFSLVCYSTWCWWRMRWHFLNHSTRGEQIMSAYKVQTWKLTNKHTASNASIWKMQHHITLKIHHSLLFCERLHYVFWALVSRHTSKSKSCFWFMCIDFSASIIFH